MESDSILGTESTVGPITQGGLHRLRFKLFSIHFDIYYKLATCQDYSPVFTNLIITANSKGSVEHSNVSMTVQNRGARMSNVLHWSNSM